MNEILAPLFYVFKNDPDEENAVSIYPHKLPRPLFIFKFENVAKCKIQLCHVYKENENM